MEAENHIFTDERLDQNQFTYDYDYMDITDTHSLSSITHSVNLYIINFNFKELYEYLSSFTKGEGCLSKVLDILINGFSIRFIIKKLNFISSIKIESRLSLLNQLKEIEDLNKEKPVCGEIIEILKVIYKHSSILSKSFIDSKLIYYGMILNHLLKELLTDQYNFKRSKNSLYLHPEINNIEYEIIYYIAMFSEYKSQTNITVSFDDYASCISSNKLQGYQYLSKCESDKYIKKFLDGQIKSKIKFFTQTDDKLKKRNLVKLNTLKALNFKYLKRENVNKKILRRFKKSLASDIKNNLFENFKFSDFFKDFIDGYYFPPFIHGNIKFRSFNTSYLIWLFSHCEIKELFDDFIDKNLTCIIKEISKAFQIDDNEELDLLQSYLINMSLIYSSNQESEDMSLTCADKTERSLSFCSKLSMNSN